jgi:carboxylesterase
MGATLGCWLASRHPVAGIVAINPAVEPSDASFLDMLRDGVAQGITVIPGIGSDVAKPDVVESAYDGTPVEPLISLYTAIGELAPRLEDIRCPVLIITSRQDHVVMPSASDFLAERVSGPVERVWLERSYHVATLDWDQPEVESRTVEFARKVTA